MIIAPTLLSRSIRSWLPESQESAQKEKKGQMPSEFQNRDIDRNSTT
jgi:hypothetical protein